MEIVKHKRGLKQGVNNVILILIFFVGFNIQSQIIGEFQRSDPSTASRDIGIRFSFKENFRFNRTEFGHLGAKVESQGSYEIKADTLFLYFEPYKDAVSKSIEVIQKERIAASSKEGTPFYSSFRVFNEAGEPESGVHLVLRNAAGKAIIAFVSDSKGSFPPLSVFDSYVADIHVSALGKQDVIIPTDTLMGHSTSIEINLQDASKARNSEKKLLKFIIKEMGADIIKLEAFENGELVVLNKI